MTPIPYSLFPNPYLWNSPDEMSQAFFIKLFATHGSFAYPEPLNFVTNNLIHPRSTVVVDGFIVPGGFIGLPLFYGSLMKIFGNAVLYLATPILTVLALLAFFRLVSAVWGRSVAWIATIAFAAHPAVIYYTARGLFPNMVFLDLLILGAMFLITRPWREIASVVPLNGTPSQWSKNAPIASPDKVGTKQSLWIGTYVDDLLGTIFLGAALLVRFSEIVWVVPLWIVFAFVGRKTLSWQRVTVWLAVLAIFFAILGVINHSLYGKPWSFGYTVHSSREGSAWILEDQIDERTLSWSRGPASLIFPFGFHPLRAARIVATYAYHLFPVWAVFAVIGFLFVAKGLRREEKIWILVTLGVGLWLMVYYGSWLFSDHPNPRAVTIGTSYMRYWLPVFALASPFVAVAVVRVSSWVGAGFSLRRISPAKAGGYLTLLLVGSLIIFGIRESVFAGDESLIAVRENLVRHEKIRAEVFATVPDYGVIITDRHDKFFFPTRKVAVGLRDSKTLDGMEGLFKHAPLYYYGVTLNPAALRDTNTILKDHGAVMKPEKYFGSETLYALSKL